MLYHTRYSSFCLFLGLSTLVVASPSPHTRHNNNILPRHIASKELSRRQTPEEACGTDFTLCDETHCCPAGSYCILGTLEWYCKEESSNPWAAASTPTATDSIYSLLVTPSVAGASTQVVQDTNPSVYGNQYPGTSLHVTVTVTSTASSRASTDDGGKIGKTIAGMPYGVVIGIGIGGCIFLIGLGAIITLCIVLHQKKKKKKKQLRGGKEASLSPTSLHITTPIPTPQHCISQRHGQHLSQYQCPPCPAHALKSPTSPYSYVALSADGLKQSAAGVGCYQPGRGGAIGAMTEPARIQVPTPALVAQATTQAQRAVYEM